MRYFLFDMSKGNFGGVYTTDVLPDTELAFAELELPFVFFGMRKFDALCFAGLYYVPDTEMQRRISERNMSLAPDKARKLRENPVIIG